MHPTVLPFNCRVEAAAVIAQERERERERERGRVFGSSGRLICRSGRCIASMAATSTTAYVLMGACVAPFQTEDVPSDLLQC